MSEHPMHTFWALWTAIAAAGIAAAVLSSSWVPGFVGVVWGWIPAGLVAVRVRRSRPAGHESYGPVAMAGTGARGLAAPPGSRLPSLLPGPNGPVVRSIGNVSIVADGASAGSAAIVGGGAPFRILDLPIDLATRGSAQQIRAELFKTYVRVLSELEGRLRPLPSGSPMSVIDPLTGLTSEMRIERQRLEQWLVWAKATLDELDRGASLEHR